MALKSKTITIKSEGRDSSKTFLLTEMPAMRVEAWAMRAIMALQRSGSELFDEDATQGGVLTLVGAGFKALAGIAWDDAEPLLAEMMTCVRLIPDPAKPEVARPLVETDIEEVGTLLHLRSEVVELHVGFSIAAALSALGQAARSRPTPAPTSAPSSPESSEVGSPPSTS